MSLDHAILGFLNYGPSSGYDLKKVFDMSVRHFWPADQSQIYRTLGRLAEQGWVEMETVAQEDRPDRKVYHITPAGRAELRHWLTTPLPPLEVRDAALIQVFFAGQLADEEIIDIFEREADKLRSYLESFNQIPQCSQTYAQTCGIDSPREVFFWMLTLENGVKMLEAQLAWIESVIKRIKNKQHPSS